MRWFNLAFVGWVVLTVALGLAAYLLNVDLKWIVVGGLAMIGIGLIVSAKSQTENERHSSR